MTTSVSWAHETHHAANGLSVEKVNTTEFSEASVLDTDDDKNDETTSLLHKHSTKDFVLSQPLEKKDENIINKQKYNYQQNTLKNKVHPPITCIEELEMWDE